ncbi:MAG TPA: energy-coupling factor transporter transmembrane component T, partial [Bacteroidota bacterium]
CRFAFSSDSKAGTTLSLPLLPTVPMPVKIPEKLSLTLFLIVLGIVSPPIITLPAVLIILVLRATITAFRPLAASGSKRFWKLTGYFLAVSILMTIINGIFIREGALVLDLAGISFYEDGILFGVRTGARLLLLSTSLLVFFGSTETTAIAAFLHRRGLPAPIVMSLLLTLHFLDSLPSRIDRIFAAQAARGAPIRSNIVSRAHGFISILGPLVLSSIVESIDRGIALELRGYHADTRLVLRDSEVDRLSPVTLLFLFLTIMALVLPWVPL